MADDCVGEGAAGKVAGMASGQIVLLENLRFHAGETQNDPEFARALASLCDVYINDAFAVCHRENASVSAIVPWAPVAAAGLLLQKGNGVFSAGHGSPPAAPGSRGGGSQGFVQTQGAAQSAGPRGQGDHRRGHGQYLFEVQRRKCRQLAGGKRSAGGRGGHPAGSGRPGHPVLSARGRRYRQGDDPRGYRQDGSGTRDSRRLDGPGHRTGHQPAIRRSRSRRQDHRMERSHGGFRNRQFQPRAPWPWWGTWPTPTH